MPGSNLDVVRETLAAYQTPGALEQVAAGEAELEGIDPEIEWDASRLAEMIPDLAGVYTGHDGVRAYWRRWLEAWSRLEYEVEDVQESGEEVVALIGNQRQWGRHSGICTALPPYAMVFTFRGGVIVRWRTFPEQSEALQAVGLEP